MAEPSKEALALFGASSVEEDRKIGQSVAEGLSDEPPTSLLASKMGPD
jgi:hypothetical protein